MTSVYPLTKCSEVESAPELIDSAVVSELSILLPLQSWHRIATASLQDSHKKSGKEELVIIKIKIPEALRLLRISVVRLDQDSS